jgi:arabinose-5-phosphate isomerase
MTAPLPARDRERLIDLALAVLDTEAAAISALKSRIDADFVHACELLLDCRGRIVVSGMGKSGHIANKIAATLASTGSPAFFVHPGEAAHGDLGMVLSGDVFIAISNSGETGELLTLIPLILRLGVPLITLTGRPESNMARAATVNLDISVEKEACPLGLAPTASTTATLAMGDALAVALLETRGFTAKDFALSHPGGSLGRRLLLHVSDVMATGDAIPAVGPDTLLRDALLEMSAKGLGMTAVVDGEGQLLGVFTDGDLRRTLDRDVDLRSARIDSVMTRAPQATQAERLAAEALAQMEQRRINALPVVDAEGKLCGALNMHTLLRAGLT